MSTESETKSAVPAGATHQCTKCGAYWLKLKGGTIARMSGACLHPSGDVRPIAEAGPAPTTAAPAEPTPEQMEIVCDAIDSITAPLRARIAALEKQLAERGVAQ